MNAQLESPDVRLAPGASLCDGRYRIEAHIADGAVASVYRARDQALGEVVALKILDPLRAADPVGRLRFEQESKVLGAIAHAGIARSRCFLRDGELEVLVLEYLPGATLKERLETGRLPLEEALAIATQLARALQACHQEGILHRDLKPENVILHPERGAVILDFGVAWFGAAANLTRTGAMVGSPRYMAPEVFRSSLLDARADVYSLGAILFEMLTGRPARLADSVAELATSHREAAPPPSRFRSDVDAALDALVARALATRPEERFATAGELERAIATRARPSDAIRSATPCASCHTPLLVDLPFCPGCGGDVSWALREGPYAVELTAIDDPWRAAEWLSERHRDTLRLSPALVAKRLTRAPVPLAVGVSLATAEQLVAEARAAGCRADLLRARALLGAKLTSPAATFVELRDALVLHVAGFAVVSTLLVIAGSGWLVGVAPLFVSLAGIVLARWYERRPLLRASSASADCAASPAPFALRERLQALATDRARSLAAGAIARAARVITHRFPARTRLSSAHTDALLALDRAIEAAVAVDTHAKLLASRSRARLAAEIVRARARADAGDADAVDELIALEMEKQELFLASVAHDLSARIAIEESAAISEALAR